MLNRCPAGTHAKNAKNEEDLETSWLRPQKTKASMFFPFAFDYYEKFILIPFKILASLAV